MTTLQAIFSTIGAAGTIAAIWFAWLKHKETSSRAYWWEANNSTFKINDGYFSIREVRISNQNNKSISVLLNAHRNILYFDSSPKVDIKYASDGDKHQLIFNVPPMLKISVVYVSDGFLDYNDPICETMHLEQIMFSKFSEFDAKKKRRNSFLLGLWYGALLGLIIWTALDRALR